MKTRSRSARRSAGLLLAVAIVGSATVLGAQQAPLRPGQSPGPRFIVPTLRSDAAPLAIQVTRALRERIASDFDMRALWVVPESTITAYLKQSGYPVDQPLSPTEARQLATAFRAEEFINGSVARTPSGGFRIQTDWSLGGRADMVQPLPIVEAAKISDLAKLVSQEFQAARRQMESVRRCTEFARARNYTGALAEARKAIAAYPRSVFGRVCIANIYDEQKLGPDSMIRISREILEIHPENQRALAFAADAYGAKEMAAEQIQALRALYTADPANRRVGVRLTRALATAARYEEARPLIDALADQFAADAEVLDLQWRVRLAMKDWVAALDAGKRLVAADSSAATRDYFLRMIAAAQAAGDTTQALGLAERGAARFPDDGELPLVHAQLLRRTGQARQALEVLNALIARNPRTPNAWLQKAATEADLGLSPDSLLATLGRGVEHGEDRGGVARAATSLGAGVMRAAVADTLASLRTAVRFYKFAEGVQSRDSTAFYLGHTSLTLAQRLANEARPARSCDLVKESQAAVVDAQVNLVKGGRAFPEEAARLLRFVPPTGAYADQLAKAFCR